MQSLLEKIQANHDRERRKWSSRVDN